MKWVQRGEGGAVVACFANKQPGMAEEALADDHPDLRAFKTTMADVTPDRDAAIEAALEKMAGEADAPQAVKDYVQRPRPSSTGR